jgi:ABC-2 type transport system permease protein
MINLNAISLVYQKELKALFKSSLIYIVASLFCIISGWLFYNYLISAQEFTNRTIDQLVIAPLYGNINFLFLVFSPLLTMNSFAEERKNHTLDLLLTSDLTEMDIILGKLLGMMTGVCFLLLLTLIFPITLSLSGHGNWPVILSNYLGIFFCTFCYLSVGVFASSLTENQIVSSLLGFSILMAVLLMAASGGITKNYIVGQIFSYLSTPFHFEALSRGSIRSYDFIYFLSFSGIFIYLTFIKLISRKW